jgi:hypothetical protein
VSDWTSVLSVGASKETGEPNHAGDPGGASVWYGWTAPSTGQALLDTCDSDFDTLLGVYTGSAVGGLTHVVSNDQSAGPFCDGTDQSEVTFPTTSGTTYRIAVDGWSDGGASYPSMGAVVLQLELGPAIPPTPDLTPPNTTIGSAKINKKRRQATFRFFSTEQGSSFRCRLDKKSFKACRSPITYKRLKPGKHTFQVKARDAFGNLDPSPSKKRFKA